MGVIPLYISVVGSHAWGMNRPDSDVDIFEVYQTPTKDILGFEAAPLGGKERTGLTPAKVPYDWSSVEVGHHIKELVKGNVNHLVALFSPYTLDGWHKTSDIKPSSYVKRTLQDMIMANPSKNIYHSLNGMVIHNMNKYFGEKAQIDMTVRAKKLAQMRRMLNWGIRILLKNDYELWSCDMLAGDSVDLATTKAMWTAFQQTYEGSDLPTDRDPTAFENFLIDLRRDLL
jgi:predicted nucleotidyltransferase